MKCPICGEEFDPKYEGARKDHKGEFWCEPCQDEFDSIDWGVEFEKRQDG